MYKPGLTDWRLVPGAAGVWVATAWATQGVWELTLALGIAVTIGGAVAWRLRRYVLALVFLLMAIACVNGGIRAQVAVSHPLAEASSHRAIVDVEGVATSEPRTISTSSQARPNVAVSFEVRRAVVRSVAVGGVAKVVIVAPATEWKGVVVGATLRFQGRLAPTSPGDQAVAIVRLMGKLEHVGAAPWWMQGVEQLREGLRRACATLPAESRGLLPALVVGDTSALSPEVAEAFQRTGLTHLCAVSGANLTILLLFMSFVLRWVGVRGWLLHAMAVLTAVFFVLLCRAEPSVVRAAAMGIIGVLAVTSPGQGRRGLRHLAAAVIVLLLIDPWLCRSGGMILSVLATAGIVVFATSWAQKLQAWMPGWLAQAIAVPLAAQVVTQPVVTAFSGQFSVVGLIANALAGPLVAPATICGFAALSVAWLAPWLGVIPAWAGGICAQVIVWVAHNGAAMPGASVPVGSSVWVLTLITVSCGVLVWQMPRLLTRRWVCIVVLAAMAATVVRGPVTPGWPPPEWAVVFCDVGQGDAAVFNVGDGQAVVVDAGPDAVAVNRCLAGLSIHTVRLVFITHAHADHYGGSDGLARGRPVALMAGSPLSNDVGKLQRVAASMGAPLRISGLRERWEFGQVTMDVVGPVRKVIGQGTTSSIENEASLVLRVRAGGVTVLMSGDVEPAGQRALLESGTDLRADIFKVPHHGSARQEEKFFAASGARAAIYSVGERNDFGHPAAKTVALTERLGMRTYRTDRCGDVGVGLASGQAAVTCRGKT